MTDVDFVGLYGGEPLWLFLPWSANPELGVASQHYVSGHMQLMNLFNHMHICRNYKESFCLLCNRNKGLCDIGVNQIMYNPVYSVK